ncbi:MAG: hypothetical protein ACJ79H_15105 [Myxococcales bacterium]
MPNKRDVLATLRLIWAPLHLHVRGHVAGAAARDHRHVAARKARLCPGQ